jgi:hypothetical protein
MTTPWQAPVASVAEAAERSHFALRRAVVDVAMGLLHAGRRLTVIGPGRAELAAAMGTTSVVIGLVLGQDRPQVPSAEDEHPVGDLCRAVSTNLSA